MTAADPTAFAAAHAAPIRGLLADYGQALTAAAAADASAGTTSRALWTTFQQLTADWADPPRRELAARYIGFPIFDAVVFPVFALSELPQLTPPTRPHPSPQDPQPGRADNAAPAPAERRRAPR